MHFAAGLLPLLLVCFVSPAAAAPKLRLTSTTVGPISIAQGGNPNAQTLEAFNAGDGSLSLSATSNASWVTAAAGSSRPCATQEGTCVPLTFTFQTSGLARGIFTAAVTVNDPNALDAPQVVTVTV